MIAVLTCINISDQYLKAKQELEHIKSEMSKPNEELNELHRYIETLLNELKEKDETLFNLEKKLEELEGYKNEDEQMNLLKDQLSQKEDDLDKAQILINDLQNKLFDYQIKLVQTTKELEEYKMKSDFKKNNRDFK